jgi:glycogen debranching enzyme
VWPWLLGPFIDACRKFRPHFDATSYLAAFPQHLKEVGLGTISETFDGDRLHRPTGCFAQAWSVAEILRVAISAKVEPYS